MRIDELYADCQGVIDNFTALRGGSTIPVRPSNPLAGLWKQCNQRTDAIHVITKIKAHRDEADATTEQELYRIRGNNLADAYAKKGAHYGIPTAQSIQQFQSSKKLWWDTAQLFVRALSLWPAMQSFQ